MLDVVSLSLVIALTVTGYLRNEPFYVAIAGALLLPKSIQNPRMPASRVLGITLVFVLIWGLAVPPTRTQLIIMGFVVGLASGLGYQLRKRVPSIKEEV